MNGKVISILNETHVLISFNGDLLADEIVEVIGEIHLPPNESYRDELKDLKMITYPKGKLVIVSPYPSGQPENLNIYSRKTPR